MYVLELREQYGDADTIGLYLVDEDDPQMVKYRYHYAQKDGGFTDSHHGSKHLLENWDLSMATDIEDIRRINSLEANILERYLPAWP